jgi:hypothetical protein
MSENIWGDESPYNDTLEYDSTTGSFVEPEQGYIPPSPPRQQRPQAPVQQSRFDLPPKQEAQMLNEVLQDLGEEDEDDSAVLSDAALRLEQGRLFQMIMSHDIFQGMDADPRAVRNVQRQIRKFARESMEVMLGMRQSNVAQTPAPQVASPFNEMEVQALKMLAAKVTGGKSEQPQAQIAPKAPAKKEITPITGSTKAAQTLAPIAPKPQAPKPQPQPQKPLQSKPVAPIQRQAPATPQEAAMAEINAVMDGKLTKKIEEMTSDELLEHNRKISERQAARKAKATNALPMPSAYQEEMLHTERVANAAPAVSAIVAALNQNKK